MNAARVFALWALAALAVAANIAFIVWAWRHVDRVRPAPEFGVERCTTRWTPTHLSPGGRFAADGLCVLPAGHTGPHRDTNGWQHGRGAGGLGEGLPRAAPRSDFASLDEPRA